MRRLTVWLAALGGCVVCCACAGAGAIPEAYWVRIEAGEVSIGAVDRGPDADPAFDWERPVHGRVIRPFDIGRTEVTRGMYRRFMDEGGYRNRRWWSSAGWRWLQRTGRTQPVFWEPQLHAGRGTVMQTDDHPVLGVSYYEAEAFCRWAGVRLPTEAEWETAAGWDGNRRRAYPWGDAWNPEACNWLVDNQPAGGGLALLTAPVGAYPLDTSPSGCVDMAGNVSEWCAGPVTPYPGARVRGPGRSLHPVRGGSCYSQQPTSMRVAGRWCAKPDCNDDFPWIGFRLARTPVVR